MQKEYTFFFDESFHDRSINRLSNGNLNIMTPDSLESYIGVFCGFPTKDTEKITLKYLAFESKIKKLFNLSDIQELKTENFHRKNFCFGIQSMGKPVFQFYKEFFTLLNEVKPIIYFDCISKIEFLLRKVFRNLKFSNDCIFSKDAFFYFLTKFLINYHTDKLLALLFQPTTQSNPGVLQKEINITLETILNYIENIKRKEREYRSFVELQHILATATFDLDIEEKVNFSYSPNCEQFLKFLRVQNISNKSISIVIDNEENTFNAMQQGNFLSVRQDDSKQCALLRGTDFISGFVGRIIFALYNDEAFKENPISDINDISFNDLETKRLRSKNWFQLTKERFPLYNLIYEVLLKNQKQISPYSSYADQEISFQSLIEYIGIQDWNEFSNYNTTSMNPEYFNTFLCEKIQEYYNYRFYSSQNYC